MTGRGLRTAGALAALLVGLAPAGLRAAEPKPAPVAQVQDAQQTDEGERRRPGALPSDADRVAPVMDPTAVPPPQPMLPREFIPLPDRWRLTDAIGITRPRFYDPYNQNVLKADKPIFGEDYFFNLEVISDSL